MMKFLSSLEADGRVEVSSTVGRGDRAAIESAIRSIDAAARPELAGDAPPLSMPAAVWALGILEAGCRFLVYREHGQAEIESGLGQPCPLQPDPSVCISVDLFFRHLPDLARLARGIAADDPLVTSLNVVAAAWPLSSVGMILPADSPEGPEPFVGDPALLQLYVDRIITRGDVTRLDSPVVRMAVRKALGDHAADLAPKIADALAAFPE